MTVNTRSIILDVLMQVMEEDLYTNAVLKSALKKYQYLSHEDRAFISKTVLGTVERKITIDYIIDSFSKVPVKKMKPVIRNLMRMSVYQIVFMQTGDFAACNEAVKLASKRGFSSLKGFVNGVLRNIARNAADIKYPDFGENRVYALSVKYSVPEWIIEGWLDSYGFEITESMLKNQLLSPKMSIRCNLSAIAPEMLCEELNNQGVKVWQSPFISEAMEISDFDYLEKLPSFNEGKFFVQDVTSMLVCHAAKLKQGDYVIDVCGAPGGKSLHAAELLQGTGMVDSRDVSEEKVRLINENIERLGLKNIKAQVKDACVLDESMIEKADVVIADLPCSGLGIIGKKPDIKYHASREGCKDLAALQRTILDVCSRYVKKGGRLIFSTCTVNTEENESNALWFRDNHPFVTDNAAELVPADMSGVKITEDCFAQFFMENIENGGNCSHDGFFIASFIRE